MTKLFMSPCHINPTNLWGRLLLVELCRQIGIKTKSKLVHIPVASFIRANKSLRLSMEIGGPFHLIDCERTTPSD